jgi:outer membrane protein
MNVIRNSEFVALRESNLRLLQQELRAANDRFDVGEVTRTDVAQAQARVAAAQSGLALAQGNLQQAFEEYRAATGHKPGHLRTPSGLPKLKASPDAANAGAMRRHPDLRAVQHQVAAAELLVQVAAAAMKPTTSLTGSLGVTKDLDSSTFDHSGTIGVQITGPLYQGGGLTSARRQAMAQRDAQMGNLHVVRHLVMQNVGNAYANLAAAQAARIASAEEVRAARVAFRGVREEAKLGARTTLDVLDAEQDLLNAQANQISAEADLHIAAYAVLASMGQLTVRDLKLDVQTYDPAAYYDLVKDAPVARSKQGQKLDRVLRALGKE